MLQFEQGAEMHWMGSDGSALPYIDSVCVSFNIDTRKKERAWSA
jgi:hypothetical protein